MDFFKGLDIEKVANAVVASTSALEEFPTKHAGPAQDASRVLVTSTAVGKARNVLAAWEELDFEGHKADWELLINGLKGAAHTADASTWEARAKTAEYELIKLCSTLLSLPDPTPLLGSTSALSAKILEVEAQNRELQAAAEAAAADTREVGALVEQHRALEAAHKELQEKLTKAEEEITAARVSGAEAASAMAQVEDLTSEVTRLQVLVKSLREEGEKAHSSLFELATQHEQAEGNRQRELEVALEELERAQQQLRELSVERDHLLQRLAAASGSHSGSSRRLPGAASGGVEADGGDATGDGWEGHPGGEAGSGEGLRAGRTFSGGSVSGDDFWERQLRLRGEQVAALQAQLESAQRATQEASVRHEAQLQQSSNALASAELTISKLQAELSKRAGIKEFTELKARAEALQQLVDVQMEVEGWGEESRREVLKGVGSSPSAVQSVLQERARKLSAQVSSLQRELSDRATLVTELQAKVSSAESEARRQSDLVTRLETDLAAVKGAGFPSMSSGTLPGVATEASGAGAAGDAAASSPLLLAPPTPDSSGGGSGALLDIVVHQRDRFRQRVAQLEDEKSTLSDTLAKTQRQLEEARADNVSLYEKLRYMERYSQKAAQASGTGRTTVVKVDGAGVVVDEQAEERRGHRYQCGPLSFEIGGADQDHASMGGAPMGAGAHASGRGVRARAAGPRGGGGGKGQTVGLCFPVDEPDEEVGGPEARYARAYEAKVNPFTEFQKSEVEQRVKSLQLHDRAVLAGTKVLGASRMARAFIAAYAVILHLFIMILLYYAMSRPACIEYVDAAALEGQHSAAFAKAFAGAGSAAAATAPAAQAGAKAMAGAAGKAAGAAARALQEVPQAVQAAVTRVARRLAGHLAGLR